MKYVFKKAKQAMLRFNAHQCSNQSNSQHQVNTTCALFETYNAAAH